MNVGSPFPQSFAVKATAHVCRRIVERFPAFGFDLDEAPRVVVRCVRDGVLLTDRDVRQAFGPRRLRGCVTQLFSPDLGGLFRLKFEGQEAVILTVIPADPLPAYARAFGMEVA